MNGAKPVYLLEVIGANPAFHLYFEQKKAILLRFSAL